MVRPRCSQEYTRRNRQQAQQRDQCRSCRSQVKSAARRLRRGPHVGYIRRLLQAHRRREAKSWPSPHGSSASSETQPHSGSIPPQTTYFFTLSLVGLRRRLARLAVLRRRVSFGDPRTRFEQGAQPPLLPRLHLPKHPSELMQLRDPCPLQTPDNVER
jgi:hypothetical protein